MKNTVLVFIAMLLLSACSPKLKSSSNLFWGNWILVEMNGIPMQLSGTEKDASIQFDFDDKRVSGQAGCNRFTGTFTADTKKMEMGELATTMMACADQAFEDKYLETLKYVRQYSVENDKLYLKDKNEKVIAGFIHRK